MPPVINKEKCDKCSGRAYQACVEVCPMRAIKLVRETPKQKGNVGYDVNLRNENAALVKLDLD